MKTFRVYLEELGRVERTVYRKEREIKHYLGWLASQGIRLEDTRYEDVMDFIGWMKKEGKTVHQKNRCLQAVSNYYNYKELENPAYKVRVRGYTQTTPGPQFTKEELDEIYNSFEVNLGSWGYFYHSNKVILGLMIYQGLELNSFLGIQIKDVDLTRGRIYIAEHSTRAERYIPLQAHQILQMDEYIKKRSEIIEEWLRKRKYLPESEREITDRLFSPQCERYKRFHGQHKLLSKKVKKEAKEKLGYKVRKLTHLRQSRICVWIEEVGVRKAQYYAGLRSVDSVERYKKKDLKGLKKAVKECHPLQ